jgi:hypothetical protein
MWWLLASALGAPPVQARHDGIPDEIEACRDRGQLWLSDPDSFEKTAIEGARATWTPVWQVRDRHGDATGHLLVYPRTCRVVVLSVTPRDGGAPIVQVTAPPGSRATRPELVMLFAWAGLPERP